MLQKLKSLLAGERKKFAAAPVISLHTVGRPQWTPRNYAGLAKEGFAGNAVGYRCVRMLAEAASSVPLIIYEGDKEYMRETRSWLPIPLSNCSGGPIRPRRGVN